MHRETGEHRLAVWSNARPTALRLHGQNGPAQNQPTNRPNFRPAAVRHHGHTVTGSVNRRVGQTFVLPQCDTRAKWSWPRPTGESAKLSSYRSATPGPSDPGQRQQANRPNFRPTAVRLQGQVALAKANRRVGQTFVLPQCDSRAKWPWPRPTKVSAKLSSYRSATPGPSDPGQGQQGNRPKESAKLSSYRSATPGPSDPGQGQQGDRPNFRPTAVAHPCKTTTPSDTSHRTYPGTLPEMCQFARLQKT